MSRPEICVDFDGVLHAYTSQFKNAWTIEDPPVQGAIEWLKVMRFHYLVYICSARGSLAPWGTRWFHRWMGRIAIRRWLRERLGILYGIKVVSAKPHAGVYIDDRGYRFEGVAFPDAATINALTPWHRNPM